MKLLWCWRCQMEIPMLDDEEFSVAAKLYSGMADPIWKGKSLTERKQPVLDYYKEITGWDETNPNAIMHHRISQYGPPCEKCGKPYRTSLAAFCAACGNKRI
jgi:hypothetical protein